MKIAFRIPSLSKRIAPTRIQLEVKTAQDITIRQEENTEENQRIRMKKYLTLVIAIHNFQGQLGKWPGPIIEANSFEEADEWYKKNTQYLLWSRR